MDYLLKSTICLTAFYGLYFFGFRRMSFHTLNRFYLLVSLALSLTIPLLSYERTEIVMLEPQLNEEISIPIQEIQENTDNQSFTIKQSASVEESPKVNIEWMQILKTIYLVGVGLMMILFLKSLLTIIYCIKKASLLTSVTERSGQCSARSHRGNLKILLTKSQSNSSFFNYVFLNPDNLNPHEEALIIAHEGFHAQRLHTLDLLISSILKAIFWFNPIVYFYQKSLKQIHEYEVDALMSATYDGREYAHLLLKLGVAPSAMITNQFSTKPLSERIQFLFKTPTKNMKKLLYFLSLPIIAVGVMAFAEEKVVRVYQEKNTGKPIFSEEIKVYPLEIRDARNYASWTGGVSDFDFTTKNISLNRITAKNYNGFHYSVNPNSLTIKTVEDVNKYIAKRSLALIVTEKATDTNGNLTKLGLAIKHLRTNQMTKAEIFDMVDLREKGKNGAFIFIESYDKNFKESQMSINYGTKNLVITKSSVPHKNLHSFVAYNVNTEGVSAIKHSSDVISYCVFPGRITQQTLAEAQAYFEKNGFELKVNNSTKDAKGNFESITLSFGNESKTFILKDLKHWIRLKSEKNSKFIRQDESIIFEADTKTLATKIFVENRMFKMTEKSGAWEVKDFAVNENHSQIDSSRFTHLLSVPTALPSNSQIYGDDILLVAGENYIKKDYRFYLDKKYSKLKVQYEMNEKIFTLSLGKTKPSNIVFYPDLTKLNQVEFPDMRFSSKTPVFLAKNEDKPFSQSNKSPSYFSKIKRNQDTLRTILETNKLGKNPIVIINDVEYPSSILYRINPAIIRNTVTYSPSSQRAIEKYGLRASDGVIILNTTKNKEFLLENEKQHQIAIENVKKQLDAPKKRVQRVVLKELDGQEYEKVSVMRPDFSSILLSVDIPVGGKILFTVNGKIVSEEEIENTKQQYTGGGCGKTDVVNYDAYIDLNTK